MGLACWLILLIGRLGGCSRNLGIEFRGQPMYVLTSRLLALFTRQVVDDLIIATSRKASDLDVEKIVERHVRRNSNDCLPYTQSSLSVIA